MRKHVLSTVAMLCMIVLALGSVDSDTGSNRSSGRQSSSASSSSSGTSAEQLDSEVERAYAARVREYEESLQAWEAAMEERRAAEAEKAAIEQEIDEFDVTKPKMPTYSERPWRTNDRKYETRATLVDTDNIEAVLEKPDGKRVTIQRDELDSDGRIYVGQCFGELAVYRNDLKEWETKRDALMDKLLVTKKTIAAKDLPRPTEPSRDDVAADVAAARAERQEQERLARDAANRIAAEAAARKAEEEIDVAGLVLLRKSVSGRGDQFGGTISGIVVNRRGTDLRYTEITFNLYDESGAQVGSAMANITGLEAGGRWKFEAQTFDTRWTKYKFDKLEGF